MPTIYGIKFKSNLKAIIKKLESVIASYSNVLHVSRRMVVLLQSLEN